MGDTDINNALAFFEGKDLFELETEERAHKGIFLAFQYPLEIPGVNTNIFLKTSLNAGGLSQSITNLLPNRTF